MGPRAAIAETGAGDAVLIAHDDPVALAQTARHSMDEVYQAPGQPRLRIALHYGEVQTRRRDERRLAPTIVGGDAMLCAARVEPHVEPGQIWATEEFRQQLLAEAVAVAHDAGARRRTAAIASTSGSRRTEPDLWVRLYRLEF